jgi:hypothetical protein
MGILLFLGAILIAFWIVGLALKLSAWVVWAALAVGVALFAMGFVRNRQQQGPVS